MPETRVEAPPEAQSALDWVQLLADEVGPRRPTSVAERRAAELVRSGLERAALPARIEPFDGYSSFAWPLGAIALAGVLPALLPRRHKVLRAALAAASVAGALAEGGVLRTRHSLSALLARRSSQNVAATVEPRGEAVRTVCLVCHLDTSRSGLMFHPAISRYVNRWFDLQSAACLVQGAEPLLAPFRRGRVALGAARTVLAAGLLLLAERELRGEDVPGANDNASGTAVASRLALECASQPLRGTRVVLLATGCEESGLLGAKAFLSKTDTSGWLFVNFDSVGAATLHYARREGIGGMLWDADEALCRIAEEVARAHPEFGLVAAERPIGLTYDTTPVLATGGRAITFVAGDRGKIANYHWPTDTTPNIDPGALQRAFDVGREMLAAIDRGEADP